MRSTLCLIIVCLLLSCRHDTKSAPASASSQAAAPSTGSNAATLPVQWVGALALKSLADLDARLAAPYDYFGTLIHDNQTQVPKTCNRWLELHEQQYEATNDVEAQADDAAKARCGTLALLRRAKPAQRGWLRQLDWHEVSLSLLPVELATTESADRERAVQQAHAAERSLQDFDASARARTSPMPDTTEVTERNNQSNIVLRVEAWADFNADGTDDVVASVVNSMTHGTYVRTRLLVMTRTAPNAMLRVLQSR